MEADSNKENGHSNGGNGINLPDETVSDIHRTNLQALLDRYGSCLKQGQDGTAREARKTLITRLQEVKTQNPGICTHYLRELIDLEASYFLEGRVTQEDFFSSLKFTSDAGCHYNAKRCLETRLVNIDPESEKYERLKKMVPVIVHKIKELGFPDVAKEMTEKYLKKHRHTA